MTPCHHCGRELALTPPIPRTESCPHCHSDLKCCLSCRFYDAAAGNQCIEPHADPVTEKAKANFCEFFELRTGPGRPGAPGADRDRARAAFDALFGKS
jgi:hypothetical protein